MKDYVTFKLVIINLSEDIMTASSEKVTDVNNWFDTGNANE